MKPIGYNEYLLAAIFYLGAKTYATLTLGLSIQRGQYYYDIIVWQKRNSYKHVVVNYI